MDEHMLFDMRHDYIQLIFRREKMAPKKTTFWRQKITSPAVFPLYLVTITSNLANYQLGTLDG